VTEVFSCFRYSLHKNSKIATEKKRHYTIRNPYIVIIHHDLPTSIDVYNLYSLDSAGRLSKIQSVVFISAVCYKQGQDYAHDTRSSHNYHQYVHRLGIHNSRPTIAGCKFYNKLPAYICRSKIILSLKGS
jgi:hypothetical protein